jgi:hypothetical protein
MIFDNIMLMLTNNYGIQVGKFFNIIFWNLKKKGISKTLSVNLFYNNVSWGINELGLDLRREKW